MGTDKNKPKWYTPEVRKACRRVLKTSKIPVFFVEFDKGIAVVVDKNYGGEVSDAEKLSLATYLMEVKEVIVSFGIKCRVEGFDGFLG